MGTYAFTDLHGNGILFDKIMADFGADDRLYFLGDAMDRGPDGLRIAETLLRDPRVTYLLGNHELLMVEAMPVVLGNERDRDHKYEDWKWNGGEVTCQAFLETYQGDKCDKGDKEKEKAGQELLERLKNLPLRAEYTNAQGKHILLSHAGYDPWHILKYTKDFVWTRQHIGRIWDEEELKNCPNEYIVHGHTPMDAVPEEIRTYSEFTGMESDDEPVNNGSLVYCHGHKICIDAWTYITQKAVVLDLDTLQPQIYEE